MSAYTTLSATHQRLDSEGRALWSMARYHAICAGEAEMEGDQTMAALHLEAVERIARTNAVAMAMLHRRAGAAAIAATAAYRRESLTTDTQDVPF